ncbi:MAG: hypothetical protein M1830_009668 [Pleopsidium flavum]|nr:MAG: hypothetical protein M1830_009668 [Pleopsidium flavum]
MFGSLLKPTPSSSLLVRRQAHLDNVKTDGDTEESEQLRRPQRRATSPSHVKSPSLFSLFPSTPTQTTRTHPATRNFSKPSPLQRSHTTPGASSPSRATFERTRATEGSEVPSVFHTPTRTRPLHENVQQKTLDTSNPLSESRLASLHHCREEVRINGEPQVESEEPASETNTTSDPTPDRVLISPSGDAKHEGLDATTPVTPHAVTERPSDNTVFKHSAEVSIARQISIT